MTGWQLYLVRQRYRKKKNTKKTHTRNRFPERKKKLPLQRRITTLCDSITIHSTKIHSGLSSKTLRCLSCIRDTHLFGLAGMCFYSVETLWRPPWRSGWTSVSSHLLPRSPRLYLTGCHHYAPVCTSLHSHWCSSWWLFLKSPSVCLAF